MNDNVVYLAFKSKAAEDSVMSFQACRNCHNKTFVVMHDTERYPMMRCAACGNHMGRIGYAIDEPVPTA